jgi:hypothetical protein
MSFDTRDWIRARRAPITLVAGWLISTILAIFAAFQSRFDLSNIDGISYISIARQYAAGHDGAAVNAYWSPMISWLMAPQIAAGVPEVLAFDLVSALAASVAIGVAVWFVWRKTSGNLLMSFAVMLLLLVFALGNIPVLTPDMLVVAWIVVFVTFLSEFDDRFDAIAPRRRLLWAAVLGVVCAFGYVTKLYLVPVFVVVIFIWLSIRLAQRWAARGSVSRATAARPVVVTLGAALLALVIVSTPWVAMLSVKYGEVTAGSSMAVNLENKFEDPSGAGPDASTVLYPPPNEYAVSFGEDRTLQVGTGSGTTSSLTSRLEHYVGERIAAFPWYLERLSSIAPFAVITFVIFGLLILVRVIDPRHHRAAVIIAITWFVYFLGYAAVTSAVNQGGNARYYWPILVLSVIFTAIMLPHAWARVRASGHWARALAFIAVVALIPAALVWQHGVGRSAPFSTMPQLGTMRYLFATPHPTTQERFATETLAEVIPAHSKIVGSNYRVTLRYAYYLESQVYGRSAQHYDPTDPAFQEVMRDAGIDYYLLFTPIAEQPVDLSTVGTTLGSFTTRSTCSDLKTATVEDCRVSVVSLNR